MIGLWGQLQELWHTYGPDWAPVESGRGSESVLVMTDLFSKLVVAEALQSKSAAGA